MSSIIMQGINLKPRKKEKIFWQAFEQNQEDSQDVTQYITLTYIRCLEDVLDIFWTSHVRSIYVLCSEVSWYWTEFSKLNQIANRFFLKGRRAQKQPITGVL